MDVMGMTVNNLMGQRVSRIFDGLFVPSNLELFFIFFHIFVNTALFLLMSVLCAARSPYGNFVMARDPGVQNGTFLVPQPHFDKVFPNLLTARRTFLCGRMLTTVIYSISAAWYVLSHGSELFQVAFCLYPDYPTWLQAALRGVSCFAVYLLAFHDVFGMTQYIFMYSRLVFDDRFRNPWYTPTWLFNIIFRNVIPEEIVKRTGGLIPLIIVEVIQQRGLDTNSTLVLGYAKFLAHSYMALMPFPLAVLFHTMWNVCAMISYLPPGAFAMSGVSAGIVRPPTPMPTSEELLHAELDELIGDFSVTTSLDHVPSLLQCELAQILESFGPMDVPEEVRQIDGDHPIVRQQAELPAEMRRDGDQVEGTILVHPRVVSIVGCSEVRAQGCVTLSDWLVEAREKAREPDAPPVVRDERVRESRTKRERERELLAAETGSTPLAELRLRTHRHALSVVNDLLARGWTQARIWSSVSDGLRCATNRHHQLNREHCARVLRYKSSNARGQTTKPAYVWGENHHINEDGEVVLHAFGKHVTSVAQLEYDVLAQIGSVRRRNLLRLAYLLVHHGVTADGLELWRANMPRNPSRWQTVQEPTLRNRRDECLQWLHKLAMDFNVVLPVSMEDDDDDEFSAGALQKQAGGFVESLCASLTGVLSYNAFYALLAGWVAFYGDHFPHLREVVRGWQSHVVEAAAEAEAAGEPVPDLKLDQAEPGAKKPSYLERWWAGFWEKLQSLRILASEWREFPLVQSIFRALSCVSIAGIATVCKLQFDTQSVLSWAAALEGIVRRDQTPATLLSHLFNALTSFVGMVKAFVVDGDLSSIYRVDGTESLRRDVEFLENPLSMRSMDPLQFKRFKDAMDAGQVPGRFNRPLTEEERLAHAEDLRKRVARTRKYALAHEHAVLNRLDDVLKGIAHRVRAGERAGAVRVEGLGFILIGKGGTGKSFFAMSVLQAILRRLDMPTDPRYILRYTAGANFQDNARPGQPAFIMDDPELGIIPPPGTSPYYADDFTKWLNVAPYNIESARAEEKGTIYADFITGVVCTNTPPSLSKMLTDPLPFWRRTCAYIECRVKVQFATEGGRLDPVKLDGSNDYHEFWVRPFDDKYYNPQQAFATLPFSPEAMVMNSSECCAYLVNAIATHYERQRDRLAHKSVYGAAQYCSVCYLGHADHPTAPCAGGSYVGEQAQPVIARSGRLERVTNDAWLEKLKQATRDREQRVQKQSMDMLAVAALVLLLLAWRNRAALVALYTSIIFYHHLLVDVNVQKAAQEVRAAVTDSKVIGAVKTAQEVAASLDKVKRAGASATEAVARAVESVSMQGDALLAFARDNVGQLQVVGAALAAAIVALTAWRTYRPRGKTIKQAFVWEEVIDAQKPQWERVEMSYFLPSHAMKSTSLDALSGRVQNAMGQIVVQPQQGTPYTVYYFQLRSNLILTVWHPFCGPDGRWRESDVVVVPRASVGANVSSMIKQTMMYGINIVRVADRDLALLRIDALPVGADNMQYVTKTSGWSRQSAADTGVLVRPNSVVPCHGAYITGSRRESRWSHNAPTQVGDCGAVLAISYGRANYIAGVHFEALEEGGAWRCGFASELVGDELDAAAAVIAPQQYVQEARVLERMIDVRAENVPLKAFPPRSSFHVAETIRAHHQQSFRTAFFPLGSLVQAKSLSTFRTKVTDSLLRPELKAYEDELWPDKKVSAPQFKGRALTIGDSPLWTDPYVDNLLAFNNASSVRPDLLELAALDFWHDAPELGQYQPVSFYEAVMGRPGEFDAIKLDTSAGQPFGGTKGSWVEINHDRKEVRFHPLITQHLNMCVSLLAQGVAPMAVFNHVLKDEPTTKEFPRVFNVGPLVLLLLTRIYVWPVFAALRKHRKFSECAIGVNMLGEKDVREFVSWFADLQTALMRMFLHGDYKFFDVSIPAALSQVARRLVVEGARKMSAKEFFLRIIDGIMLMTIQTIRFIKNDLVMMVAGTPSGVLITGEFNSLVNSIIARCAYYWSIAKDRGWTWEDRRQITRELLGYPKWFREVVMFMSLGDDNMGRSETKNFNMFEMYDFCRNIGMTYTRADKKAFDAGAPVLDDFYEVTFLKRSFRYDDEYNCWKACLEKKSIIKMMLMEKASSMSRPDHCAVLALNACREAFFHGRAYFAEICAVSKRAMQAAGILGNAHYNVRAYENYHADYVQGVLKTWGADMDKSETRVYLASVMDCGA